MDDSLETPNASAPPAEHSDREDEDSSADEDGGLDWTKLPSHTPRTVIPKRGEKDFEPKPGGGSGLQVHVLDRARSAMFEALKGTRSITSKAISYAVWYPAIARAHVTVARGVHFTSMGHSAPRPSDDAERQKVHKRVELLPEEAIYLVERGSLFCWKESNLALSSLPRTEEFPGAPMSVQQVYAEMIGAEDLTLEKYQVFAYLKRLGYAVTRTDPPSPWYPLPPQPMVLAPTFSILQRIRTVFSCWTSWLRKLFSPRFNWWSPISLYHHKNHASLYRSLRFIPSGHQVPLQTATPQPSQASPYRIFFNLYKPATPFRKSAPGPPDFQVVVINARTTPMPSLHELSALFDVMPELPPPMPRQRRPLPSKPTADVSFPATSAATSPSTAPQLTLFQRLFPWAKPPATPSAPVRRPNPFMALKAGKKLVVIAAVDAGSISFFRFGEGEFSEWPMI